MDVARSNSAPYLRYPPQPPPHYFFTHPHSPGQVRLLIVAPNVDAVGGAGGLDEKVSEVLSAARENGTPVVFALSK